ncbi:TetR/AcrR family transcriptional regulator [Mangrovibacillus cuniculi]|uniref:TetR/AcrR family transcriptional regulator n=1 Tax=Mangrovibacillus cuniculi TaxID=2593652 RepID=A0A7S8CD10_9BACI|nr:TetR/AcrR family transcriptional regulator [Mangrovibacillus cuniculi]QPC47745.1 TetR/AcrR family transcriptional regulator [Mangrovibacillus cuniculi]
MTGRREVQASVKDERLVLQRREQMIAGAVRLFKEKGFHRTTTREIAKAAGFSIGTLYEYIRTKEDVLYLVCDHIYDTVRARLDHINLDVRTVEGLQSAIAHYFLIMDELQDEVLVMYQEVKSLTRDALPYVLQKEKNMVDMLQKMIQRFVSTHKLPLTEDGVHLLAHNMFVQGQMWAFRRWALRSTYTLTDYTKHQTEWLIAILLESKKGEVR